MEPVSAIARPFGAINPQQAALDRLARMRPGVSEALPTGVRHPELMVVAQEFEAIFVAQMIRAMRQARFAEGFLDGGLAGEVYREMLDDQLAIKMAQKGGFGLAQALYEQLALTSPRPVVEEQPATVPAGPTRASVP